MIEINQFISNRFGEKLDSLLRLPQKSGTFPGVLFVSGLGADLHEDNNSFDEISKKLVEVNFASLQFSFSGLGNSEGDYKDMTFERQAKQIEDVLKWMKNQTYIDSRHIQIIAQSCGAPSTLFADIKEIQSVIFICGAFNTYENLKRMFIKRNAFNPEGVSKYPRSDGSITILNRGFWDTIFSMNENDLIKKQTMPVFLVGGTLDDYVMKEDIEHAYSLYLNYKKKLKIYTDGNHGMDDVPKQTRDEFLNDITIWMKAHTI